MKKTRKKKSFFKVKKSHKTRLAGPIYRLEAETLLDICHNLEVDSRIESLPDRIKIRRVINSLLRNADVLSGGA